MTQAEQFIKARSKCKISPDELLTFIWGSKAIHTEVSDYANKVAANDLDYPPMLSERSRSDQISWMIKSTRKYTEIMETDLGLKPPPDQILSDASRLLGGVGLGMTLPVIDLMGTDAQKQKWIHAIQAGDIVCCYGQTELAHGSDVQSLQTTAIFDQKQDSFIINTPNIGAYKWWPGDMGISSNYVLVYAQVITHGKSVGVLPLFFQVRDLDTHKLFPGVGKSFLG
jgi:acyl-CoA oxidase